MHNKSYTQLTLEELLVEERKIRINKILSVFIIGFLIVIMIYGVVKNSFGLLYILIPIALIMETHNYFQKNKENLKEIRKLIGKKTRQK